MINKIIKKYIVIKSIVYIVLLANYAFADDLGTLTITAEEEAFVLGETIPSEVTSHYSLISRDIFIERGLELTDILTTETGVEVLESGGLGSFSTLSLRGASNQQVKVYLDGIPLNEGYGGGVDLGQISLGDSGGIEIFRGFTPIHLTGASIGGAVNIKTLKQQPITELQLGIGSFHTYQASLVNSGQKEDWDWLILGNYQQSDNDFEFLNDNGTAFNQNDDKEERRQNAEVRRNNQLIKFSKLMNTNNKLNISLQHFEQDQGIPSIDNNPSQTNLYTRYYQGQIQWERYQLFNQPINLSIRGYIRNKKEIFDDRNSQIGLAAQYNRYDTRLTGLQMYTEKLGEFTNLYATLNWSQEKYTERDLLGLQAGQVIKRDAVEIALQSLFFREHWLIAPSLRYQNIVDDIENGLTKSYLSPQLGFKYSWRNWQFLSNIAQYQRVPSFFERYGDRGILLGNEDLQPETGLNFDIGLIYQQQDLGFLQQLTTKFFFFYSDIEDAIVYVYDAQGVGRADNIAAAKITGIEFVFNTKTPLGYIDFNYTYQDPINESSINAFDGNILPGHFTDQVVFRWQYPYKNIRFFYEYIYENGLYYDSANLLEAPEKRLQNIGLIWKRSHLQFTAEIRNLEDENFEAFNGFPAPGRSYHINFKYKF